MSILMPNWNVGDRAWHCCTHGGPDRRGDRQAKRWQSRMRECEILAVEPARLSGKIITIRHLDDQSERVVSDSWLSLSDKLPPPYFEREDAA